jgi:ABC-type dipeptide/oligopeptide/nickel transport system ATPase component
VATKTACPFCFTSVDSSNLWFQCSGRGNKDCPVATDDARKKLTGNATPSYPTFEGPKGRGVTSATCPKCGGEAMRRACPACHTALPIDFVGTVNPMIGLVGSKGSGKTVLMTVLVKQLREQIAARFNADIRIATDNPDGQQGIAAYRRQREVPLFGTERDLPAKTDRFSQRQYATPIVLRWRAKKPTMLALIDSAGEDLGDETSVHTLNYLMACEYLIITLDPFSLPSARARISLPREAQQVDDEVPIDVVANITAYLRTYHKVATKKKVKIPIAIVFTKIDAFYPTMDPGNPIMASESQMPAYDETDGLEVHEQMRALLTEWDASALDRHLEQNYENYRYFAVSALGAEPEYASAKVAAGGVRPHRVQDPVLWLMAKAGTVKSVKTVKTS